jgi:hypothetical protein
VYLALSYFALVTPFFFAGLVMGAVLTSRQWNSTARAPTPDTSGMGAAPVCIEHRDVFPPVRSHHAYAAKLIGSGTGCLLALAGLSWWGGVGVIIFAALVAMLAGSHCAQHVT